MIVESHIIEHNQRLVALRKLFGHLCAQTISVNVEIGKDIEHRKPSDLAQASVAKVNDGIGADVRSSHLVMVFLQLASGR